MADPLSIAGLVTGVVSLGIQLHNDLQTFLDIVKHRDEDIAKLARQAATLAQALDAIDRSLQNSNQANNGVVDSATIIPLLDASRQELFVLQQEVASLTKTSKGQKLKASAVVEFAKVTTQKLKYPRQRANIQKLEEGLDQANTTLQLALNAFGLSELSSIKSNTEVVVHGLSNIQKTLPDVEARVAELSGKLMATNQTATQSIQNIDGILNLAISSHEAGLKQLGQAQSNEFSQIKQLIQDLSLKMDANASTGSKDIEVHRNLTCLMSKPSALKALCDEYSNYQPTPWCPSDAKNWPACTFQCRRTVTRQSFEWGPFRLSTESKEELVHHESCQWAQFDTSKRSKAISFAYRGFTHLLRHAVVINFRLKHGAGGFSFGPGIVHYPVIDEDDYAPFRLVRYVGRAIQALTEPSYEPSWTRQTRISQGKIASSSLKLKVLEAFSMHISRACFNGTIVPRAVNTRGQTLLHCISLLIQNDACGRFRAWWTPSMITSVHGVLAKLIMCNVPSTVYDNDGRLAHLMIANCIPSTNEKMLVSMTTILRLFTSRDMDIDPSEARDRSDTFQPRLDFLKPLPEPSVFSKAFGCNQLGTAILQQNISAVRSLLSRAPSLIFERDLNGMTPLHYAVIWKDGLSIILEQVPVENFAEGLAWDIFQYALSAYQMNHRHLCSESCHCSECMMLFLDHSWYFAPCSTQGRDDGTLRSVLEKLSLAAQKKLLLYLKQARQDIVGPILQKLFYDGSGRQLDIMGLPTKTVHRIIDHLQKIAATFPPATRRARIQAAVDSFNIYCEIKDAETADAVWQAGFHEVNYHAATDFPPLAYSHYNALTGYSFHREDYVLWLLDHGADPFQPLRDTENRNVPTMAAHKAIHCITPPMWDWDDDLSDFAPNWLSPTAHEVARRLCSEPTTDSCLCACSANGCTPFLILLRNLSTSLGSPEHTFYQPKNYAHEFMHIRTMLAHNEGFVCQYEGQFHEALRLFTFMALGIRHTCCKKDGHHNDGDAEEVGEEDRERVEVLKTLMEQWHDVRFKSSNDFWCFLRNDWVTCLDKVFEDMRRIDQSEEHRIRLQSLGVQLQAPIVEAEATELPVRFRSRGSCWCDENLWLDLMDTVTEGGDTSYFDRIIEQALETWSL